jgi:nitrite reductase/ring-hydroxylating ferredoxin subunit
MQPFDSLDRLEKLTVLDPAAKKIAAVIQEKIQPQSLRDLLHGVWLGHPLHPVLTDIPIGAWTSSAMLDLFPKTGAASSALITVGLVSAGPTAISGWTDWSELNAPEQRTGLVHAATNYLAMGLYAASLYARVRRRYIRGKAWGFAGLATVLVGGSIGGHLSYRRAAGANHTADVGDTSGRGWTGLGSLDELPEGQPAARQLGHVPVMLLRQEGNVRGLVDRCSHLSGPLHEGELTGAGADLCIVCPWHGSQFRISDGGVVHGPATADQPRLEIRITDGQVEARIAR